MRTTLDQVRSVVLDGALALCTIRLTFAKRFEQYLNIFAQCADEACNAAYPNLNERFVTLLADEANPIVLDPPMVVHPNCTAISSLPPVLDQIDLSFRGSGRSEQRGWRSGQRRAPSGAEAISTTRSAFGAPDAA
jgi:hypothetical protein